MAIVIEIPGAEVSVESWFESPWSNIGNSDTKSKSTKTSLADVDLSWRKKIAWFVFVSTAFPNLYFLLSLINTARIFDYLLIILIVTVNLAVMAGFIDGGVQQDPKSITASYWVFFFISIHAGLWQAASCAPVPTTCLSAVTHGIFQLIYWGDVAVAPILFHNFFLVGGTVASHFFNVPTAHLGFHGVSLGLTLVGVMCALCATANNAHVFDKLATDLGDAIL